MYNLKIKAVCKDCPDRSVEPNCHTTCSKYIGFKAEHDRVRKEIIKESNVRAYFRKKSRRGQP